MDVTKYRKALWKLDHTICMNSNEDNIRWNIDSSDLYKDDETGEISGYNPDDTDCKSIEEALDCLEDLEEALNMLDYLFKHAEYQTHPDPFFYEEQPERIVIEVRKLVNTPALVGDSYDFTENNKGFELVKKYFIESGHSLKEN